MCNGNGAYDNAFYHEIIFVPWCDYCILHYSENANMGGADGGGKVAAWLSQRISARLSAAWGVDLWRPSVSGKRCPLCPWTDASLEASASHTVNTEPHYG